MRLMLLLTLALPLLGCDKRIREASLPNRPTPLAKFAQ